MAWGSSAQEHRVFVLPNGKSLLSSNCNTLLCTALNERERLSLDWFAMLHADCEPDDWWIDTLIAEAEKHNATLMSAVVPIKDQRGITSTAIGDGSYPAIGRITLSQLHDERFPETFGAEEAANGLSRLGVDAAKAKYLLANTGVMVYRLAAHHPSVCFANFDGIRLVNGRYEPWDVSEDWHFSRLVADAGGKVMCTRKVHVVHHGNARFGSGTAWGSVTNDCTHAGTP